jgi:hypothetical protein
MFENKSLAIRGGSITPESLELMSKPMQRQALSQIEQVIGQGLVMNTRENERTQLATEALLSLGMLSALEEHVIQICPACEGRARAIVDSWAIGATNAIARW